ncbi:MAG: sel1 repeat family protein [Rhodospirillales bacterium]|nr:sel1 repeat family protein [Rhodospirillales bacterium]
MGWVFTLRAGLKFMKQLKTAANYLFLLLVAGCAVSTTPVSDFRMGLAAYKQADYVEALSWYQRAADKGLADAQNNLGELYQGLPGVPEDLSKALYWYRLAAQQGNIKAMTHLSLMYEMGRGVPQDFAETLKWLRRAADSDASAQFRLGNIYHWGQGVPQDINEAMKWYRLAAAQGHMNANVAIECHTSVSRECAYLK